MKENDVLEKKENDVLEKKENDVLEEIETIMLKELRFYSNENPNASKHQRLNITDRMCKSASVILATENLKERRYMNRTERKDVSRKIGNIKKE